MKKWIALVLVLLLALGTYVAVGPYLTVRAIRIAVKEQDAAALSKQVDFPALRTSLKAQLTDRLVREAGPDLQSNPFAAFGLSIAGGVIGGAVDTMVTPMGLGAMMEGRKVWKRVDDGFSRADADTPAPEPLHDAVYRYESLSRFTATVDDEDGRPIVFVLTRGGLRWELSDIRLPPDPASP
ncbi:MAG: DUF2939 domain-containing protein [Luteimonas sp.]